MNRGVAAGASTRSSQTLRATAGDEDRHRKEPAVSEDGWCFSEVWPTHGRDSHRITRKGSEMVSTHRWSIAGALMICLVGAPWNAALVASEEHPLSSGTPATPSVVDAPSDVQRGTSARPVTLDATGERPTSPPTFPSQIPERSRFTVRDEILTANGLIGVVPAPVWRTAPSFIPMDSSAFLQRGRYRGRGRRGRHEAATAIILGAVASIAGTAVLVYANRPECSANETASGCGYGTKVIGGAVLSAGIVGVVAGAVWR
jgi:hypothetical protein